MCGVLYPLESRNFPIPINDGNAVYAQIVSNGSLFLCYCRTIESPDYRNQNRSAIISP